MHHSVRVRRKAKPVLRYVHLAPLRDGDIKSIGSGPCAGSPVSGLQPSSSHAPLEGGPRTGFKLRLSDRAYPINAFGSKRPRPRAGPGRASALAPLSPGRPLQKPASGP